MDFLSVHECFFFGIRYIKSEMYVLEIQLEHFLKEAFHTELRAIKRWTFMRVVFFLFKTWTKSTRSEATRTWTEAKRVQQQKQWYATVHIHARVFNKVVKVRPLICMEKVDYYVITNKFLLIIIYIDYFVFLMPLPPSHVPPLLHLDSLDQIILLSKLSNCYVFSN